MDGLLDVNHVCTYVCHVAGAADGFVGEHHALELERNVSNPRARAEMVEQLFTEVGTEGLTVDQWAGQAAFRDVDGVVMQPMPVPCRTGVCHHVGARDSSLEHDDLVTVGRRAHAGTVQIMVSVLVANASPRWFVNATSLRMITIEPPFELGFSVISATRHVAVMMSSGYTGWNSS